MTAVGQAFVNALGTPDSLDQLGFKFEQEWDQASLSLITDEIGTGWYLGGFLYLLGRDVPALDGLLKYWQFLFTDGKARKVIGRNIYGALLVIEDADIDGTMAMVGVIDPLNVAYFTNPNLDFTGLLGNWLPQGKLPSFMNKTVYSSYQELGYSPLNKAEVLGIKTPLTLGGKMELANFQVESLEEYTASITAIYRSAFP